MRYLSKKAVSEIIGILEESQKNVLRNINHVMTNTYYLIGHRIVEEQQRGKKRADYGEKLIKELSIELQKQFGRGFSERNLEAMRQFYLTYQIPQTLSAESKLIRAKAQNRFPLSWSHYIKLIRIENQGERKFYEIESKNNNWSVRELQRQIDSSLYERLVLSRDKKKIKLLSKKGHTLETPKDAIKEPYVLEFLGLKEERIYSENEFEAAVIDKLEHFLSELGKGFIFVSRQNRISFDERHFYIDLVFYNRILKCFVLIDLKMGDLKHQDLGQMQMYVNYYDRKIKLPEENNTVGIILCKDKSETLVEITLPKDNKQIFASKYKMILPSKNELKKVIENKK
jgi:predicted nuclease of restriction endonuclease-like (RecB) superfamily